MAKRQPSVRITVYLSAEQASTLARCKPTGQSNTDFFETLLEDKRQQVDSEKILLDASDKANLQKLRYVCQRNDLSQSDTIWKAIKQEYWLLSEGKNQRKISERIEHIVTEILRLVAQDPAIFAEIINEVQVDAATPPS